MRDKILRPLCRLCDNNKKVLYEQIIDNTHRKYSMCEKCPAFRELVFGEDSVGAETQYVRCKSCGTDMCAVAYGGPLGCSECYTEFCDVILETLKAMYGVVADSLFSESVSHVGRSPSDLGMDTDISKLNKDLQLAVARENYELAAWIRDYIDKLQERIG